MRCVILDGYVDEPACLGVPPFISPYPRYVAGAMLEAGVKLTDIHYATIDQLRSDPGTVELLNAADFIAVISGTTVPGRYLGATPISLRELNDIIALYPGKIIVGGPVRLGYSKEGGIDAVEINDECVAKRDIEAKVFDRLSGGEWSVDRWRTTGEIARWAQKGAFIIGQHPGFPVVMCELETYRGCLRDVHCSFCTEQSYGVEGFREIIDVVGEVEALYAAGARYFRIGRQPDLFSYQSIDKGGELVPNPPAIEKLYKGIRRVAPGLKVLHLDNVNPATVANFPGESEEIVRIIVKHHTPGDVAAMGVESADPVVIRLNDLKVYPEDVLKAVGLINEVGAKRGNNGLPELLPGLNFVHGLKGETKRTYELNFELLERIYERGLLLRRINLRQAMAFPGTPLSHSRVQVDNRLFAHYKKKVQKEIDSPMLKSVVPTGVVLKDVFLEACRGNITFGRQMASYPLLVGIPEKRVPCTFSDVLVTGHGYRSVTGVPVPLNVNTASMRILTELLGDKKVAGNIIASRPFKDTGELEAFLHNSNAARHLCI